MGIICTVTLMTVMVSVLRERQRKLTRQLYLASTTDPLTGLLNRRAFEMALARELDRAESAELDLSLVCFDLDHFKECNDRHGHAAGDRLLKRFAGLLTSRLGAGDVVARVGGEEFVLILFDSSGDEAQQLAEDLGREMPTEAAMLPSSERMSFSAGVASRMESDGANELLTLADRALYAAKEAGRQRVARWKDGIQLGEAGYAARRHQRAA